MIARAAAGVVAAGVVAWLAVRSGALTRDGGVAAALVGTLSVAAGWAWGLLLVAYFVASVGLSRAGGRAKAERTASVVDKGGARDAWQVLANGLVFTVLAWSTLVVPGAIARAAVAAAALGALAASAADTWATEIGTLSRAAPRSLRTLRPVPAGTSGAASVAGTMAMVAGAVAVAAVAQRLELAAAILPIALGGIAGAVADSGLGATLQARWWCAACERATERRVHSCGTRTIRRGGVAWLENDAVNLAATLVGAAVAGLLAIRPIP